MAPGRVDAVSETCPVQKPTVYVLDQFHPEVMKHAQSVFDAVLPDDSRYPQWREKAEYLLIRGSSLTAEDIKSSPNLKALGKQGVGKHSPVAW